MDRIYGNALLTVVAADTEHADVGFAGVTRAFAKLIRSAKRLSLTFT